MEQLCYWAVLTGPLLMNQGCLLQHHLLLEHSFKNKLHWSQV